MSLVGVRDIIGTTRENSSIYNQVTQMLSMGIVRKL